MSFRSWLHTLRSFTNLGTTARKSRRAARCGSAKRFRPQLECFEDRYLPSTFTVLNLLDSGPDSLRAAVAAANTSPGADEINFAVTGTIALTSGQLDITDSLTINGPGADALTVSGNHASRVFGIAGNPTVTIANLTVANGFSYGSPGGGISMAGGTVNLANCTVSGNTAHGFDDYYLQGGNDGLGGGLYVAGGTLTLDQGTVTGNTAWGGTGFDDYGTIGGYGGYGHNGLGGGLYIGGGMVHVNQCTISGNHAGGATAALASATTVTVGLVVMEAGASAVASVSRSGGWISPRAPSPTIRRSAGTAAVAPTAWARTVKVGAAA